METFIKIFSTISVFLVIITTYLSINKLWIRKHEPEVADSISISSTSINLFVMLVGIIISIYNLSYGLMVSYSIWTVQIVIYIFIAIGLWVNDGLSLRSKILRALNMDRKECTVIIKDLLHTTCIENILKILCILAMVDGKLHKKEEKILKDFAKEYNADYKQIFMSISNKIAQRDPLKIMYNLKHEIKCYLSTSPQKSIVTWLQDLIEMLIKADDEVTEDESIMLIEIQGLFLNYLSGNDQETEKYNLILLPQTPEQDNSLLNSDYKVTKLKNSLHGCTTAYIADSFYSEKLAEKYRSEYVNMFKCFVTIEKF